MSVLNAYIDSSDIETSSSVFVYEMCINCQLFYYLFFVVYKDWWQAIVTS
jgi:hypothetical protein